VAQFSICFRMVGWISSVDIVGRPVVASTVTMGDSSSHDTYPHPSTKAYSYQALPTNRELSLAKQSH